MTTLLPLNLPYHADLHHTTLGEYLRHNFQLTPPALALLKHTYKSMYYFFIDDHMDPDRYRQFQEDLKVAIAILGEAHVEVLSLESPRVYGILQAKHVSRYLEDHPHPTAVGLEQAATRIESLRDHQAIRFVTLQGDAERVPYVYVLCSDRPEFFSARVRRAVTRLTWGGYDHVVLWTPQDLPQAQEWAYDLIHVTAVSAHEPHRQSRNDWIATALATPLVPRKEPSCTLL